MDGRFVFAALTAMLVAVAGTLRADDVEWSLEDAAHELRFKAEIPAKQSVALFLDAEGLGTTVYRLVFSSDAKVRDDIARDDNTNRDRFVLDETWRSCAKVKVEKDAGKWRLDASIPFSAFPDVGASAEEWGVRVALDERVSRPGEYAKRRFSRLDRKAYPAVIAPAGALKAASEPVTIRMIAPCYRDSVFETMKLKTLVGEVVLTEGIGSALAVTLSGPGTEEVYRIASAAATNRFSFAFADRAKGDYFIRAGKAEKRIRNLPYRSGEIWIDSNKVIYRDGKKIFPFGWFSETYGRMYPGVNIAQTYNVWMRSLDELDALANEAEANGCGLIVSPMQRCSKTPYEKLFGTEAARKAFDADGLGGERREALEAFARRATDKAGFFAYYLRDEPEGKALSPVFFREAKRILEEVDPYHPTMIVNYTVNGIRQYAQSADILCPDTYPVYTVGGPVVGKFVKTYQWASTAARCAAAAMFAPQAFDWDYKVSAGKITRGPTYLELRAQSLLAIAGDARGLLLYSRFSSNTPSEHLRRGGEFLAAEILESQDLFLAPSIAVDVKTKSGKGEIVAAVKQEGAATMLIAVNTAYRKVKAEFSAKELPDRLYIGGKSEGIRVAGGKFADEFGPYEAKVYHCSAKRFSPAAASREIEAAEAARRKPGNIALAPKFLTWVEMKRLARGESDGGFPRITASSSKEGSPKLSLPYAYFLQDGIADIEPYLPYHGWTPDIKDRSPSLKIEFGGKKRFSRLIMTCCRTKAGEYAVSSATVEADGRKIAELSRGDDGRMRAGFEPVEADSLTIRVNGRNLDGKIKTWTKRTPWLSEIEVY